MAEVSARQPTTRSAPIAGGLVVVAIGLMAWDHLLGNQRGAEDDFPVDAPTFFVALGLIALAALVVYGLTVPRARRRPDTIRRAALVHSGLAVLLAVPASWLGFPVVVAGGGIILGLTGLDGPRRWQPILAIMLGLLVVIFAVAATAYPPADAD